MPACVMRGWPQRLPTGMMRAVGLARSRMASETRSSGRMISARLAQEMGGTEGEELGGRRGRAADEVDVAGLGGRSGSWSFRSKRESKNNGVI